MSHGTLVMTHELYLLNSDEVLIPKNYGGISCRLLKAKNDDLQPHLVVRMPPNKKIMQVVYNTAPGPPKAKLKNKNSIFGKVN